MTDYQTELENFILWLIQVDEIPAEERNNFINHLVKVGTLDEKAYQYIEHTVDRLYKINAQKAAHLEEQVISLSNALIAGKTPELSMKNFIIKSEGEAMMETAYEFTEEFQGFLNRKAEEAETTEKTQEQAEIAALKAGL